MWHCLRQSVPFQGRRSLVFGSTSETWSFFFWVFVQMFGGQWMYVNVVFFSLTSRCVWRQKGQILERSAWCVKLPSTTRRNGSRFPSSAQGPSYPRDLVIKLVHTWHIVEENSPPSIRRFRRWSRFFHQRSDKRWTGFDLDPSNSCCCCCVFKCTKPQKESTDRNLQQFEYDFTCLSFWGVLFLWFPPRFRSGEAARVYLGIRVQLTVAGLIGGNFLMNIIENLGSARTWELAVPLWRKFWSASDSFRIRML